MTASFAMAKPKKPADKDPSFPATPAYKQWVWKEIRRRHWTLQRLVDEAKRADRSQSGGIITATMSTATLIELLGGEHDARRYMSNTVLMPAINKALEIVEPTICDPESPLEQLKDRLDALWRSMDAYQRERFLRSIEGVLGLAEPNTQAVSR